MATVAAVGETDYLVIGGGTAGCVLASRLSEGRATVTLLEAGVNAGGDDEPEEIRDSRFRTMGATQYFWPDATGQARVLGGGSSVNGMHAKRGLSTDYDEWRQLGVIGWGWDDVLPFFKRLETDCDFHNDMHGASGPVQIRRVPEADWSGLSHALAGALSRKGYGKIEDVNGQLGDGYAPVPHNFVGGRRLSTATAYLTAEVRKRPNLRIVTDAEVSSLLIEGRRVVGAAFSTNGHAQSIRAGETIVSAGALRTPLLMLQSGIGPGEDLRAAGIAVAHDLPGVGANLNHHPTLILVSHIARRARAKPDLAPSSPMLLRYSSNLPGCSKTDMLLNVWERVPNSLSWDPLAHQLASFFPTIYKSFSQGSVKLDASRQMDIQYNVLSDERDMDRMVGAARFLHDLLNEPAVGPLVHTTFLPNFDPFMLALRANTPKAQVLSIGAAMALSGPRPLRERLLKNAGTPLDALLADEGKLRELLKLVTAPAHVSGTCRMGDPAQRGTVLDSRCKVVGIDGLRVVDASIFPTMMAGGTNLPTMMAAEKAAAMTTEDARQ